MLHVAAGVLSFELRGLALKFRRSEDLPTLRARGKGNLLIILYN